MTVRSNDAWLIPFGALILTAWAVLASGGSVFSLPPFCSAETWHSLPLSASLDLALIQILEWHPLAAPLEGDGENALQLGEVLGRLARGETGEVMQRRKPDVARVPDPPGTPLSGEVSRAMSVFLVGLRPNEGRASLATPKQPTSQGISP